MNKVMLDKGVCLDGLSRAATDTIALNPLVSLRPRPIAPRTRAINAGNI